MDTVVLVMMILVCFNYVLKQTYRKKYFVALSAVVCALFVGLMWQFAIEQSRTRISDWIANTALMLDVAVILSIEVVLQISFCIVAAHIQTAGTVKKSVLWTYRFLRWFPGILIYPVLFSLLVAVIFALPGVSFPLIAWSLAATVLIIVPLATWGLRVLLPEKAIRLELLFLSNALIAILGIIGTVNGSTAVAGISEVDWGSLAGIVALVIAGLVAGLLFYNFKMNRKINKF